MAAVFVVCSLLFGLQTASSGLPAGSRRAVHASYDQVSQWGVGTVGSAESKSGYLNLSWPDYVGMILHSRASPANLGASSFLPPG